MKLITSCLLFCIVTIFALSCDKSPDISNIKIDLECTDLIDALLDLDEEVLTGMFNPVLVNFTFQDQDNNSCLNDNNLNGFSDLINETCNDLTSSVICCECIETFPLTSEIRVLIDSSGMEVQRIIDLISPIDEGMPLEFSGIHL